MMSESLTAHELERLVGTLLLRAWTEPSFKERLLDDATGVVRDAGIPVPERATLQAVEPGPNDLYLVLAPTNAETGTETAWQQAQARAAIDPLFKQRLQQDPAGRLRELGAAIPSELNVHVLELTDTQGYLLLPPTPAQVAAAGEDAEVAGYDGLILTNTTFPIPSSIVSPPSAGGGGTTSPAALSGGGVFNYYDVYYAPLSVQRMARRMM